MKNQDLTFNEVCELLGKSKRTLSRYIKKGLIIPEKIKSQKGIIEYRFNRADLEVFKIPGTDKIRQDIRGDTRQAIRQDNDVITLLKETTQVFRDQLKVKDEQLKSMSKKIDNLIERNRESNILLKGLANKVLMLEDKTKDKNRGDSRDGTQDRTQKIKGFIYRLFKG